jgi:hypothetical protein
VRAETHKAPKAAFAAVKVGGVKIAAAAEAVIATKEEVVDHERMSADLVARQ